MTVAKFKLNNDDQQMPKTKIKGVTVFNKEKNNTTQSPMFFGPPLGVQRYDGAK